MRIIFTEEQADGRIGAEIQFEGGRLEGMRLTGFTVCPNNDGTVETKLPKHLMHKRACMRLQPIRGQLPHTATSFIGGEAALMTEAGEAERLRQKVAQAYVEYRRLRGSGGGQERRPEGAHGNDRD